MLVDVDEVVLVETFVNVEVLVDVDVVVEHTVDVSVALKCINGLYPFSTAVTVVCAFTTTLNVVAAVYSYGAYGSPVISGAVCALDPTPFGYSDPCSTDSPILFRFNALCSVTPNVPLPR